MEQDIKREVLQATIDLARVRYGMFNLLFLPPKERIGYVYFGYSEVLGRVKVGYTNNLARREKQIAAQFTALSLDGDFKILGAAMAPEHIARLYERIAHTELSDLRYKGEWFRDDPRVFDLMMGGLQARMSQDWAAWLDAYGPADMEAACEGLGTHTMASPDYLSGLWRKYLDNWARVLTDLPFDHCIDRPHPIGLAA